MSEYPATAAPAEDTDVEVETAKPAKKVKTLSPCLCRAYAVETLNDAGEVERLVTGCDTTTTAKFAPGHDAKLKSLLIGAGASGDAVIKTVDNVEKSMTAMDAASEFGFVATVEKGIEKLKERDAVKAQRLADRAAKAADREAVKLQRAADRAAAKAARDAEKAAKSAEVSEVSDVEVNDEAV